MDIADLVNKAYRPRDGARGWTHEAELVTGQRISAAQLQPLFCPDSDILLLHGDGRLIACVHVQSMNDACAIGMLATDPDLQNLGLGKQMLARAEFLAIDRYAAKRLKMSVLSSRSELLAFYERRGYVRTGACEPYPADAGVGVPKDESLCLLLLEKLPCLSMGSHCAPTRNRL